MAIVAGFNTALDELSGYIDSEAAAFFRQYVIVRCTVYVRALADMGEPRCELELHVRPDQLAVFETQRKLFADRVPLPGGKRTMTVLDHHEVLCPDGTLPSYWAGPSYHVYQVNVT